MKKIILFLLLLPLFLMMFSNEAEGSIYPGYFIAESKQVQQGEHFSVNISLMNNDQDLGGLRIPLQYNDPEFTFDSVSYNNSFVTSAFIASYSEAPDSNLIILAVLPDIGSIEDSIPSMTVPNGLFATLYFTVSNNPTQIIAVIDSVNEVTQIGSQTSYFNCQLSSPDGLSTFYPGFSEGIITVMIPTAVEENIQPGLPSDFGLSQNYPNPFNPSTNIEFSLPTAGIVKLEVYNVLGQLVETLVDEHLPVGYHAVEYDASNQTSGIYFYRLLHQEGTETKKMVLVK